MYEINCKCTKETKLNTAANFLLMLSNLSIGPLRLECQNYVNVTDNSRFWNSNQTSGSDINTQLQDSLFTKDWTRFLGSNSTNVFDAVIPDKCISVLTETSGFMDRSPCGAIYRGWMHNSHPAVTNGKCVI